MEIVVVIRVHIHARLRYDRGEVGLRRAERIYLEDDRSARLFLYHDLEVGYLESLLAYRYRCGLGSGIFEPYLGLANVRQGIVVDLKREYARLTQVEVVHPRRIRSDGQATRIADIEQLIAYLCRAALSGNIDTRRRDFDRRRLYGLIVILA